MSKLIDYDVPSFFNNLPKYLPSQPAKKRKIPDQRQAELDLRDHQVLYNWHENLMKLLLLMTFFNKISEHVTGETNWIIIKLDSSMCCCIIDTNYCLVAKDAVKILPDLSVHVYCKCIGIDQNCHRFFHLVRTLKYF